jgi:hypothetical protein
MINYLWITSLIFLLVVGCQPRSRTDQQTGSAPTARSPLPLPLQQTIETPQDGGIDAGGGNGVNGQPLESYRVNILTLPEYTENILPIIQNLQNKHEVLAANIIYILKHRSWYFIPVELKTLPSAKIGTYFNTEQVALQNMKEIWVNSDLYNAMKPATKAELLIHEIVMGIKLLSFTTGYNQCLAEACLELLPKNETAGGADSYLAKKRNCARKHTSSAIEEITGDFTKKKIKLSEEDYANIRELTHMLSTELDLLNSEDLTSWLQLNHF